MAFGIVKGGVYFIIGILLVFLTVFWLLERISSNPAQAPTQTPAVVESVTPKAARVSSTSGVPGIDQNEKTAVADAPVRQDATELKTELKEELRLLEQAQSAESNIDEAIVSETEPPAVDDAPANEDEPEDERPELTGSSHLAGRVLDSQGRALTGVTILAEYRDPESENLRSPISTRSDEQGKFRLDGIPTGDYAVRNSRLAGYGDSVQYVRSGSESVELVLESLVQIRVSGTVTDNNRRALSGVEVNVAGTPNPVTTNGEGRYQVAVEVQSDFGTTVRFSHSGYNDTSEVVNAKTIPKSGVVNLDVSLKPLGNMSVSGRVVDDTGLPVVGELVRMYSAKELNAFRDTTKSQGEFRITGLSPGSDWRIAIIPKQQYERYESEAMSVAAGMPPLEITLKRVSISRISGTFINTDGNPVGPLSLVLSTVESPGLVHTVIADETGRFHVDNIASGNIRISTQSQPHMDVSGINLPPGGDLDLSLVVDSGTNSLQGNVFSQNTRAPVGGAEVLLIWNHSFNGLTSNSFRRSETDTQGLFQFSGLGAGAHQLSIIHQDHKQVDKTVDVGPASQPGTYYLP